MGHWGFGTCIAARRGWDDPHQTSLNEVHGYVARRRPPRPPAGRPLRRLARRPPGRPLLRRRSRSCAGGFWSSLAGHARGSRGCLQGGGTYATRAEAARAAPQGIVRSPLLEEEACEVSGHSGRPPGIHLRPRRDAVVVHDRRARGYQATQRHRHWALRGLGWQPTAP